MRFECLSGLKQRLQSGKNTGPSIGAGSVSGVIRSVRSLNFLRQSLVFPVVRNDAPIVQRRAVRSQKPCRDGIVEPFFGAQIASKCVFTAPTSRSARRIADAARCLLTPEPKLAGCGKGVVF